MARWSYSDSVSKYSIFTSYRNLNILRTESYDEMDPVGVDPRWEQFAPFHEYLKKAFPLM